MESWGSAGGAEAPHRVDPHHAYSSSSVCVCIYIYLHRSRWRYRHLGSSAVPFAEKQKGPQSQSRVVWGGTTMDYGF